MTADAERLARIYSAQARAYAETWSPIIGTAGRHLLETLPWRECKRVLDIGTGAGEHLPDIRRLAAGAWILGIDRSAGMLELARSHGVPLALMDGMDVALRPQSFDVALMVFMLSISTTPPLPCGTSDASCGPAERWEPRPGPRIPTSRPHGCGRPSSMRSAPATPTRYLASTS